ncbi:MAG: hypothetical protein HZA19_01590 [Nitrospirae bacterium]|nr:hypothetical protein [Nitrospirota bacterium]
MTPRLRRWLFFDVSCIIIGFLTAILSLLHFTPWVFMAQLALGLILGGIGFTGFLWLMYGELKARKIL